MLPQEIQTAVAEFLELHDLARLVRVNKDWNHSCTPILWRALEITGEFQYKWFCSVRALRSLSRQGHHIRTLRTLFPYTLIPFQDADVIPDLHLTRLELTIPPRANLLTEDHTVHIINIIKRSPSLQHLYIGSICRHPGQLFFAIDKHLTRLRYLSLFNISYSDQSFRPDHYPRIGFRLLKAFFDNLPSELEYFALGAHTFWNEGTKENGHSKLDIENYAHDETDFLEFERYFGPGVAKQHKHLKILSLRGMEGDQDKVLPVFLRGCPNLEVFDNPTPDRITARPITGYKLVQAALEEAVGYHLKDLTVVAGEESEWETDGDIAHTISTALSSITGNSFKEVWNKINIQRDCSSSMKATAEAIGRTCQKDLVILRIKNASTMESTDVQLILSHASALREFSSTRSPRLVARDMVAKPWACQWLTTLCVQICGIPRPDLEMDEHGQVLYAVDRKTCRGCFLGRKDIQRQVYQQLGRLVCLEVLNLSCVYREGSRDIYPLDSNPGEPSFNSGLQTDCLDWTLESGLGQLASLKELREVDVRMTWHRLGVRELEWMIQQLPRLNVLKGLNPMADPSSLTGDYISELGVEMWARSHKPDWLPCSRR
ncbi:hypothetical protein BG015_008182 [Linnemannia schmuckeri]|uniref:F-box domain-containing protein n=1 Tax=Linnemannia schmuckeri TaxID=64567 RepID=A0A9P5RXC8_9FUNG|nr:hypothetical protein BG015_008182 [Linnemannia schmuckeri]